MRVALSPNSVSIVGQLSGRKLEHEAPWREQVDMNLNQVTCAVDESRFCSVNAEWREAEASVVDTHNCCGRLDVVERTRGMRCSQRSATDGILMTK